MKILVTGGCGFIGSHVVDSLINKGYDVAIIDNLVTGKKDRLNPKARFYQDSIQEDISHVFENESPDIVIHTAAQAMLRESLENPQYDAQNNILATINLLEECKKHNVKKIIYTSTGGARYGEPESLPVKETHSINPCSPYGISKHTAEHYVWMYSQLYDIDHKIFCFGNVYGPRDDPSSKRVTAIFIDKILKDETPTIYGDGNQTRDFIYVKDLAEFIVDSIDKHSSHNLFNLANGTQVSVNEIFSALKEITGFEGEPDYADAVKGEVRDIVLDTTRAREELGWNPEHDIKEGLKETYEWFRNNKF